MRFEDMEKWTVDQLKVEVLRLSDECEKKQHEIIDLKDTIKSLQKELKDSHILEFVTTERVKPDSNEILKGYEERHQSDCIRINELTVRKDNGDTWIVCPYCGKKALKILPATKIHRMPYKCKGSNCKKEFMVNV